MAIKKKSAWEEAQDFVSNNIAKPIANFAGGAANFGQNLIKDYQGYNQQYQQKQTVQNQRNQQLAQNFAKDFSNTVGKATTAVGNYFNPNMAKPQTTPIANNFWNSNGANLLGNIQQRFASGQIVTPAKRNTSLDFIPGYKQVSGVGNFVQNIPAGLINSVVGGLVTRPGSDVGKMINGPVKYGDLNSAQAKLFYQGNALLNPSFKQSAQINTSAQEALANIGDYGSSVADAYLGAGLPKTFVEQLAKKAGTRFLPSIIRGGIENIIPAAASGAFGGLESGRNAKDVQQQLTQAAQSGLTGGVMGFAGGVGFSAAGAGLSKLGQSVFSKLGKDANIFLVNRDLIKKHVLGTATAEESARFAQLNQEGAVDNFLRTAFPEHFNSDGTPKPTLFDPKNSPLAKLDEKQPAAGQQFRVSEAMRPADITVAKNAIDVIKKSENDLNAYMSPDRVGEEQTLRDIAGDYLGKKESQTMPINDLITAMDERIQFDMANQGDISLPKTTAYPKNTTKYNKQMNLDDLVAGGDAITRWEDSQNNLDSYLSDTRIEDENTIRYLAEKYVDKKRAATAPIKDLVDDIKERIRVDSTNADGIPQGLENNLLAKNTDNIKPLDQSVMGSQDPNAIPESTPAQFRTAPGEGFDLTKAEGVRTLGSLFNDKEIQFLTDGGKGITTPDGKVARGVQYDTLVKVVEQNGKVSSKDVYHEAFHAYARNFADKQLYDQAILEAMGRDPKLKKPDAEEFLAEAFTDYMAGRKTFTGKVQQFFQYMLENIKSMIGRENSANLLFGDIAAKRRPNAIPVGAATAQFRVGQLPRELAGSKPRFGQTELNFESQIDKALYTVGNPTKPSKADAKYMDYLRSEFPEMSDAQIREMGMHVKEGIKNNGAGQPGVLDVPDSGLSDLTQKDPNVQAITQEAPVKPDAPKEVMQMIETAIKSGDESGAQALHDSYSQDYTLPPYQEMSTSVNLGLNPSEYQPSAEQISSYEKQVLDEVGKEVSGNSIAKDPNVAQYAPTIRAAMKVYNLLKNKGTEDIASITNRLAKNEKFGGAMSLDAAITALREAGVEVNSMDDLAAIAKDLPTKKGIPVGKKETRAYFSDIPPAAVQDALNNPNSALRNAIRQNIKDRIAKGEGSFSSDPKVKGEQLRGFVKTVRESLLTSPEVAQKVGGTYKTEGIDKNIEFARAAVDTDPSAVHAQIFDKNEPYTIDYATKAEVLAEKYQEQGRWQEAADTLEEVARRATESGQGNASLKYWSRMTPNGMIRYAQKEFDKANKDGSKIIKKYFGKDKIELIPEMTKKINEGMKKANEMPEGPEKQKAVLDVLNLINDQIPPTASELFDAYRYQNILSNPRTHARNIFSNTFQTLITKPATLAVDGGLDFVQSTLTGKEREAYVKDAPRYYKDVINAFPNAWTALMEAFKGNNENFTNPDLSSLKGKRLPIGLQLVTRVLEGQDRFFGEMISSAEYNRQIAHGTAPDIAKKMAEDAAAYSLFRSALDTKNKTGQGHVLTMIDQASSWAQKAGDIKIAGQRPLKWFVPFIRTPMNVAKQYIEYSPVGITTLAGAKNKSEQLAKTMLGTTALGIGATYALQGKTTWTAPKDEKERELWYGSGKKPFSVNLNGQWVPIQYLGPFGVAVAIPAAAKDFAERNGKELSDSDQEYFGKVAAGVAAGMANFWSQQTFLAGMGAFVQTMQGDSQQTSGKTLGFVASQAIPGAGLMRFISSIVDPTYRKTKTFGESFLGTVPGVSNGAWGNKSFEAIKNPDGTDASRLSSGKLMGVSTDYVAPWTTGQSNNTYNTELQGRQDLLRENALINSIKKAVDAEFSAKTDSGQAVPVKGNPVEVGAAAKMKELDAVKKKSNELFDTYFKTEDPGRREQIKGILSGMGVDFNQGMENYVMKDLSPKQQGLSESAYQKLQRSKEFDYARKLRDNYSALLKDDSFVNQELARKGITKDDLAYDDATLLPDDVQLDEVKARTDGLSGDDLLTMLTSMRVVSEGSRKPLLTETLIGKLNKEGKLSDSQADFLKSVEWDSTTGKLVRNTSSSGKAKKVSTARLSPVKINIPQIKLGGSSGGATTIKPVQLKRVEFSAPPTKSKTRTYTPRRIVARVGKRQGITSIGGLGR